MNNASRWRERVVQAGEPRPWERPPGTGPQGPEPPGTPAREHAGQPARPGSGPPTASLLPRSAEASAARTATEAVSCDHAVFTSLKSPNGEGYRIVAASRGIRPEERSEITRWSPSHGALGSGDEQTVGLVAYPLSSGRYAVGLVRCAGFEHTGRGGPRVLTHVVLLQPKDYAKFDNNPVRVHATLRRTLGTGGDGTASAAEPLALPAGLYANVPPIFAGSNEAHAYTRLVHALLTGRRWLIPGLRRTMAMLEWAFEAVPAGLRPSASVTAGIRYTPTRPAQLVLLDRADGETRRMIQGQDIQLCDPYSAAVAGEAFGPWMELVQRWASAGRFRELAELTAPLDRHVQPAVLARLAAICTDLDKLAEATAEQCQTMRAKYNGFAPTNDLEKNLVARMLDS